MDKFLSIIKGPWGAKILGDGGVPASTTFPPADANSNHGVAQYNCYAYKHERNSRGPF